jgi:hypothetical protein
MASTWQAIASPGRSNYQRPTNGGHPAVLRCAERLSEAGGMPVLAPHSGGDVLREARVGDTGHNVARVSDVSPPRFFRSRQFRLTGNAHPSFRILNPKGEVRADQRA